MALALATKAVHTSKVNNLRPSPQRPMFGALGRRHFVEAFGHNFYMAPGGFEQVDCDGFVPAWMVSEVKKAGGKARAKPSAKGKAKGGGTDAVAPTHTLAASSGRGSIVSS